MPDDDVATLRARIAWLEAKADEEHGHARAASDEITRLTHEVIGSLEREVQRLRADLAHARHWANAMTAVVVPGLTPVEVRLRTSEWLAACAYARRHAAASDGWRYGDPVP